MQIGKIVKGASKDCDTKRTSRRRLISGSMTAQAESVVDSILEIIDISGVQESPSREVYVRDVESSSPHGLPTSSLVRLEHAVSPPGPQA